jgi:hypothetical protein
LTVDDIEIWEESYSFQKHDPGARPHPSGGTRLTTHSSFDDNEVNMVIEWGSDSLQRYVKHPLAPDCNKQVRRFGGKFKHQHVPNWI